MTEFSDTTHLPPYWWEEKDPSGWMYEGAKPEDVRIVSAAIRITRRGFMPHVIPGARHFSPGMRKIVDRMVHEGVFKQKHVLAAEQGFIDQYDRYWTREQAWEIVMFTGQPLTDRAKQTGTLYSEDLY